MNALRYPIMQVAYAVPDPAEAAIRHSKLHGSGPFFRADHVPVIDFVHRGKPQEFDHTTVFGQWGDVMIEFFVQHNPDPSHNHDLYPFGCEKPVFHHIAMIPDDLEAAIGEFSAQGFEVASRFHVGGDMGCDVAFIDTRTMSGHMTEMYTNNEMIRASYTMAREAAASAQDRSLITTIRF